MTNSAPIYRKVNLRSIHTVLALAFLTLLGLIWLIGTIGRSKLEQIRDAASESSRAYSARLELANEMRAAASELISEAKNYRLARDYGVPKITYQFNLNKEKFNLERVLKQGSQRWGTPANRLPANEVAAWEKIVTASDKLWETIKEEEKPKPRSTPGVKAVQPSWQHVPNDPALPVDPNQQPPDPNEDFYKIRLELDSAAKELVDQITGGREKFLVAIADLTADSVKDIGRARLVTVLVGLMVAAFTHWLTQKQLTRARTAERQVQEEQGRKSAVFDSLSDDIVVVGEQGEVLEVNQSFLSHFKLTDAELKVQDYRAALSQVPEVASFVGQALQNPDFKQRQRERIEVKAINGRAEESTYNVSVSPLKVGEETHGRVVVMDDVSEEERFREELRRSRTLSAVGQITAQVAHEIYNPLGAVKLNLDLLEMQTGEEEGVKHTIGRLKRGVDHLSTIVMDLRYLTRPREPERQPTDLNKLLDEVVELASDRLERSRVIISRNYFLEAPEGKFDSQQLRKVFLNLVINAVEASPQNAQVELHTRFIPQSAARAIPDLKPSHGAFVVSVVDHGVGMTVETKRRLFEAFYTTKKNGTGLGMMITQEIVKKHGGKIEVESEEGKGTKVSVYLPSDVERDEQSKER